MQIKVVTGGCGFVGRNLVKRLQGISDERILIIDDLSTGRAPEDWLQLSCKTINKNIKIYGNRLIFIRADVRLFFRNSANYFKLLFSDTKPDITDVFHLAAVVGGRLKIEDDPLAVAIDLSIDAEFFRWSVSQEVNRIMYPSSSAAYPVSLQTKAQHRALQESDINFEELKKPDLSYGWAKLTGEYLARMTASKYNIPVCCIRPFSGYGGDQELEYPVPAIVNRFVKKEDPIVVWGDGNQSRDFIHIDDVLDGMLLAMDKITNGSAVNLGTGVKTSFLDVLETLSKIADYKPKVEPLLVKPVGVYVRYADISYMQELLDWTPQISLEEGMIQVYKDIQKQLSDGSS